MSVYDQNSGMVPWDPNLLGAAYDVRNPIVPPRPEPYGYKSPMPASMPYGRERLPQRDSYTSNLERKLRYMTSSRNVLIFTTVLFILLFLGALTGALLLAFPNAFIKNIDIKVTSTRIDLKYTSDPNTVTLVENTMCSQVKAVASTVANINYCTVKSLQDASPGVRAFIVLKTELDGKGPSQVVAAVGEAVVRAAALDSNWIVAPTDISVDLPGYIPPRAISS